MRMSVTIVLGARVALESLKPHPVDCDAGVHYLTRLEPKFIHIAPPVRIRGKVNGVFVELAIDFDWAAGNATIPVHRQPRPDYRSLVRAPFEKH